MEVVIVRKLCPDLMKAFMSDPDWVVATESKRHHMY